MSSPYIPPRDADFSLWLANFAGLIAATPANYGLLPGDAAAITAQDTAFQAAYTVAINPTTRTAATVAAKDNARALAQSVVRPYAQRIRNNTSVSDALKVGIGITVPSTTPTPVPPPATAPTLEIVSAIPLQQTLGYRDPGAAGKAKPAGSIGVELFRAIGTVPAVDPAQATYFGTITKSPFRVPFDAGDVGKTVTYFARFATRSGPAGIAQVGPFSAPLAIGVI